MTDQARFSQSRRDGVVILDVGGEIDILNAGELRAALADAAALEECPLVVALSDVGYFDSQTLEILVEYYKRLQLTRRRMALVAASSTAARRLLDVSAISNVIPTHESIDQAVHDAAGS